MKGMKMWQWAAIILGAVVLYNLLQPKQSTGGITPAQASASIG